MEITNEMLLTELHSLKEKVLTTEYELYRCLLFIEFLENETGHILSAEDIQTANEIVKKKMLEKYPSESINFP